MKIVKQRNWKGQMLSDLIWNIRGAKKYVTGKFKKSRKGELVKNNF